MNGEKKRLNRCRIEWMKRLTPHEYCLLDKLLFQSNLTQANNGKGFVFHVRQLSKETGMSLGMISNLLTGWNTFIKKSGSTRNMVISFDYERFEQWIVHRMNNIVQDVNNDCSPHEPRSKKEEVTTIHNNTSIIQEGSREDPSEDLGDILDGILDRDDNARLRRRAIENARLGELRAVEEYNIKVALAKLNREGPAHL